MALLPFLSRPLQGVLNWFSTRESYDGRIEENITRSWNEAAGARADAAAAQTTASAAVPGTRTVNGKALSANITLTAADVSAKPSSWAPGIADVTGLQTALDGKATTGAVTSAQSAADAAATAAATADGKAVAAQNTANAAVPAQHGVTGLWLGTQAEYDAIGSKVATVVYVVKA